MSIKLRSYILSLLAVILSFHTAVAIDSLKVMSYNLYRFPNNPPYQRASVLGEILDYQQVDLLMACEIINDTGVNDILRYSFQNRSDSFAAGVFHYSESAQGDPLQQMVFYNTRKLTLIHQYTYITEVRDINHYVFQVNDITNIAPAILDVFVAHLKSSEGAANRLARANMVDSFLMRLNSLPASHYVLFGGDFNLYQSNNELAYQKIIDTNNHNIMVDPINTPGNWHDNEDFAAIHTQATRTSLTGFGLGGSAGGVDDRFDFIFMTKNFWNPNARLKYVVDSYKAFGNNGNCFDKAINDSSCTGFYPQSLREHLWKMSDHLPVVLTINADVTYPTTGIKSNEKLKHFKIIGSNIIKDQLAIEIMDDNPNITNAIIYNTLGQIVKQIRIQPSQKQYTIQFSEWLPNGMYFINYKHQVLKFIKQ